jgi:hypothetical protein
MNENDQDDDKDQDLTAWLRRWEAPPAPASLGRRVTESYRSRVAGRSVWSRLLRARVSVPLPLAALVVGLLLGIGIVAGRQLGHGHVDRGDAEHAPAVRGEGGLANLRPLSEVRVTVLKGGGSDERR